MSIAPGSLAIIVDVETAIEASAFAFGVAPMELIAHDRHQPLATYRMVAMRVARIFGHSLPAIGRSFGDRDHTTVLHACRRVEADADLERRARLIADEIHNTPRSLF